MLQPVSFDLPIKMSSVSFTIYYAYTHIKPSRNATVIKNWSQCDLQYQYTVKADCEHEENPQLVDIVTKFSALTFKEM